MQVISKATIQRQAKDAYADGKQLDANPYLAGSVAHDHWYAAYIKRRFEVEGGTDRHEAADSNPIT